ncbi:MAG: hypothetical protein ACI8T1_005314 [Verrucomicrobiales bacterium]|jgi:hypothetical protein
MKPLFVSLFSFIVLANLSLGETPASKTDPKALALIDKLIKATGGEEALKKIKTRVSVSKITMAAAGVSIEVKMSQKAPNKVYVEQSIPGFMEVKQGFDGKKGWGEDTAQGFRIFEGTELEQLKREGNINRELSLKTNYPVMKMLPDADVEGKKTHVIEATSKDERKETWYLDAESGLMVQIQQKMSMGPQGEMDVTIGMKDYQEMDGIKLPMLSEIKNPAFGVVELTISRVKHNVAVNDKIFEAPEQ